MLDSATSNCEGPRFLFQCSTGRMQHEDRAAYCIFSMGQACLGLTLTAEHPSLTVSSSRGRCKLGQDVAACVRLHERMCVHERTNFVRVCVYGHACAYERVTGSGCVCGKKGFL